MLTDDEMSWVIFGVLDAIEKQDLVRMAQTEDEESATMLIQAMRDAQIGYDKAIIGLSLLASTGKREH